MTNVFAVEKTAYLKIVECERNVLAIPVEVLLEIGLVGSVTKLITNEPDLFIPYLQLIINADIFIHYIRFPSACNLHLRQRFSVFYHI